MLGRHTALITFDNLEDPFVHLLALLKEILFGHVFRFEDVQVQVAVADVAEPDNLEIRVVLGDHRVDFLQEPWHLGNHHRDIVLIRRTRCNGL